MDTSLFTPAPACRRSRLQGRATATVSFPAEGISAGGDTVTRCHNLRPLPEGGLEGVGRPAELLSDRLPGALFVPGGVFTHPDGVVSTLLVRDFQLIVCKGAETGLLGTIASQPLTAVATGEGWTVMTAEGAVGVAWRDGVWGILPGPATDGLPSMMFERLDGTTFFADTGRYTATGQYDSRSEVLETADAEALASRMSRAYLNVADQAAASRQFIQPVMARYRLRSRSGDVVYTSPPVMVSPEGGLQLTEVDIPMSGEGFRQFGPVRVSARGFTLGLRLARGISDAWREALASVEILVSPQFHPLVAAAPCTGRPVASADNTMVMHTLLPGVSRWRRPGERGGMMHDRVNAVLASLDESMRVVASSPLPSEGSDGCLHLNPYRPGLTSASGEMLVMNRLVARRVEHPAPRDVVRSLIMPPHSFVASASARNGDAVLWGGITSRPFDGYPLEQLCVSASVVPGGATPAAAVVDMSGGARMVRESVFHSLRPVAVSPLLVYPSAEAGKLTLLTPGVQAEFPLSPAAGGKWSFYLDPALAPVALGQGTADGFAVPVARPRPCGWPELVVLADVAAPLSALDVAFSDVGAVKAVAPVARAGSSLDMSRVKFYAFGPGGISMVVCRPGTIGAALLIDRRGVEAAMAVTETPAGVVALAGGEPVLLAGNRVRPVRERLSGEMAGWNAPRGELWLLRAHSLEATVVNPSKGYAYTRSVERIVSLLSTPSGLRMLSASGAVLDASAETGSNDRFVHCSRIPVSFHPGSRRMVRLGLSGTVVAGEASLVTDCGTPDEDAAPLATFSLEGTFVHPCLLAVRAIHCHYMSLRVEGIAPSPSKLMLK